MTASVQEGLCCHDPQHELFQLEKTGSVEGESVLKWITSEKIKLTIMSNCQTVVFLQLRNVLSIREAITATRSCHFCFEMSAVLMLDDMVAP